MIKEIILKISKQRIALPVLALLVTSCSQMPEKKKVYKPKIKKEISYTFHVQPINLQKEGLAVRIEKADLHSQKFTAEECNSTAPAPVVAQPQAAQAKPASPFGAFGALAAMGAKAMAKTSKPAASGSAAVTTPGEKLPKVKYNVLPSDVYAFKVTLKNTTTHIMALNSGANELNRFSPSIWLFNPVGKRIDTVTNSKVNDIWKREYCWHGKAADKAEGLFAKAEDLKGTVLLPGQSYTRYVYFAPESAKTAGKWLLSLYEVPVATDRAGRTSITEQFHVNAEVKKWETTFKKVSKKGKYKKVSHKQVF
jgi:hypothetical protein